MKLPLASGLLSAAIVACASTGGASSGRYVMRVDRTFDRSAQPSTPAEPLPAESYRLGTPSDRWEISIDGSHVVLTQIGGALSGVKQLEGHEEPSTVNGERRFAIGKGGLEPNGFFVLRGDEAELTLFGSGLPIVLSERGKVVAAR